MKSLRLLSVLLITVAFAIARDTTYELIWKPKAGQEFKYVVSVDSTVGGSKVVFGAEMALKVPKVEVNGDYTVESTYTHPTLTVDGTNMNVADTAADQPEVQKFNSKGKLISEKVHDEEADADPFSHALSTMMEFHSPEKALKIGESWTAEVPGDEKAKVRPVKVVYTVESLEKIGAAEVVKIAFVYTETQGDKPVKADGAFLFGATDGSLYKVDATVSNLRFDEKTPVDTTKVKVERK